MSESILVVEDDPVVNELISENLQQQGYQVIACHNGQQALQLSELHKVDMVLLDLMLPGLHGLEVLARLRQRTNIPVLILTALGNEKERIQGLQTGADDYLSKPFNMLELMLRVKAILRRYQLVQQPATPQNSIEEITQAIPELTRLELDIIQVLRDNLNTPISKAYLYQVVLHREFGRYDRTLDMHISNIRKKCKRANWFHYEIKTVHGKGYMLSKTTTVDPEATE